MTAFDSPNTDPGHLGQPGTDSGLVPVSHVVMGQGTIRSPSPTCGPRPVPSLFQEGELSHVGKPSALPSPAEFRARAKRRRTRPTPPPAEPWPPPALAFSLERALADDAAAQPPATPPSVGSTFVGGRHFPLGGRGSYTLSFRPVRTVPTSRVRKRREKCEPVK